MDNFDYKKYLKEGRINKDFSQLDEKKQDSKKGNKEEQKRMEGAIRDNEIHIDKLNRDKKADKKKLAKLKADEPKDVSEAQGYDDREDESLGARKGAEKDKKQSMKDRRDDSYGKFGKRDAEKKGKNKVNKEEVEIDESAIAVAAGVASIFGGAVAADKAMDALEAGKLGEKGKSFAKFLRQAGSAAGDVSQVREEDVEEGYGKPMYDEDDDKPMKEESSKMKKSELKAKIKETILAELSLAEDGFQADQAGSTYHAGLYNEAEEDVDVDVDFEDEVNVDAEGDDIEIDRPAVKAKVNVGLSPEEEIIQDSLKAAMDAADAIGNDKLGDQIGNTITFFTREYVVGRN